MIKTPLDRKDFYGLEAANWLYTGAESVPLKCAARAVDDYFEARGTGPDGRLKNYKKEASLKNNLSKILNVQSKDIVFGANTSELIFAIILSIDWKPGDNIVFHTLEFPAGIIPSIHLKQKGVEVRVVQHNNWTVSPEQIMSQVDHRTKLVISSWVSYVSGSRIDYQKLYSNLKNTDTLLLMDVTQALGAFNFDASMADFTVCSSYKWLLGIHGLGILAVNSERTEALQPGIVGWYGVSDIFSPTRFERYTPYKDARRFSTGYPSFPTIWALEASTTYLLEKDVEVCSNYVLNLSDYLIARLKKRGFTLMTPENRDRHAGNVSIICPKGEKIADLLAKQKIYVWGGDGRLRASIHAFVSQEDVDLYVSTLSDIYHIKD